MIFTLRHLEAKKREIWTIEPDEDVAKIMELVLKKAPRGERSRIINAAISEMHAEAAAQVAELEAEKAQERARALRNIAEGKH